MTDALMDATRVTGHALIVALLVLLSLRLLNMAILTGTEWLRNRRLRLKNDPFFKTTMTDKIAGIPELPPLVPRRMLLRKGLDWRWGILEPNADQVKWEPVTIKPPASKPADEMTGSELAIEHLRFRIDALRKQYQQRLYTLDEQRRRIDEECNLRIAELLWKIDELEKGETE